MKCSDPSRAIWGKALRMPPSEGRSDPVSGRCTPARARSWKSNATRVESVALVAEADRLIEALSLPPLGSADEPHGGDAVGAVSDLNGLRDSGLSCWTSTPWDSETLATKPGGGLKRSCRMSCSSEARRSSRMISLWLRFLDREGFSGKWHCSPCPCHPRCQYCYPRHPF